MKGIDRETYAFLSGKIDARCAAEFRRGVTVGAVVGFVLGVTAMSFFPLF